MDLAVGEVLEFRPGMRYDLYMERLRFSSGTPWEPLIGYSRSLRVGGHIYVSSTAPIDSEGTVIGVGSPYEQTRYVIQKVKAAIEEAGGRLADVVKTRLYVTDISRWEEFARAHREVFEKIRPVNTIVEVASLVDPRMMVEMEAEAIIDT